MASTEIRERRRTLRYRTLLVRQAVQMKNKIAVPLMKAGVSYNKQKLHRQFVEWIFAFETRRIENNRMAKAKSR